MVEMKVGWGTVEQDCRGPYARGRGSDREADASGAIHFRYDAHLMQCQVRQDVHRESREERR
jgi:hypothetical protein